MVTVAFALTVVQRQRVARALPCTVATPQLVVYNRLPWFKSREWEAIVKNQTTAQAWEHLFTSPDKDSFTPRMAMDTGDVGSRSPKRSTQLAV